MSYSYCDSNVKKRVEEKYNNYNINIKFDINNNLLPSFTYII